MNHVATKEDIAKLETSVNKKIDNIKIWMLRFAVVVMLQFAFIMLKP